MKDFLVVFSNGMQTVISGANILEALSKYKLDSDINNITKILDLHYHKR